MFILVPRNSSDYQIIVQSLFLKIGEYPKSINISLTKQKHHTEVSFKILPNEKYRLIIKSSGGFGNGYLRTKLDLKIENNIIKTKYQPNKDLIKFFNLNV